MAQGLIGTPAAERIMRTDSFLTLQRRMLQNLIQLSLYAAAAFLADGRAHLLPGYGIFYNDTFPVQKAICLIGEKHVLNG